MKKIITYSIVFILLISGILLYLNIQKSNKVLAEANKELTVVKDKKVNIKDEKDKEKEKEKEPVVENKNIKFINKEASKQDEKLINMAVSGLTFEVYYDDEKDFFGRIKDYLGEKYYGKYAPGVEDISTIKKEKNHSDYILFMDLDNLDVESFLFYKRPVKDPRKHFIYQRAFISKRKPYFEYKDHRLYGEY